MVENHIAPAVQPRSTGNVVDPASPVPQASGIEFRALLDRLREQAAALERAAEKPLRAEDLSHAVTEAGASLTGALSIAEGLLEAYRSSRVTSAAIDEP